MMMADRRVGTVVFEVQELAKCSLSLVIRLIDGFCSSEP